MTAIDAYDATLSLLGMRASSATVCPSEVARMVAASAGADTNGPTWRDEMPEVHAAIDRLVMEGRIRLSWKGEILPSRVGPYRIGRGERGW